MMAHEPRLCPECKTPVVPTMGGKIYGHLMPSRTRPCPGSFKPFNTTIPAAEPKAPTTKAH